MSIKNKVLTFVGALAVCGVGFLLLDLALMNMQGLSLIFER
ncbi:hypothetical protein MNBD_ALPHA09-1102 [hydrothermal vent metagenome]|uniref:Uncharacterized protein n=1 Tax=hydrothermal vent metagenome TaxID=652676 RepID=A0A3B0T242_9ZZZZ